MTITLYDLAFKTPNTPLSPNTLKVRLVPPLPS